MFYYVLFSILVNDMDIFVQLVGEHAFKEIDTMVCAKLKFIPLSLYIGSETTG